MVKISIIMPVYNDETKLENSIGSVLNQTLTDFELICVDDGSTDNSLNVLKKFAEKDNRIKVFSQENNGSGSARNNGISKACGEYIAFLDSDDYIVDENAYYQLYTEAKKWNIDMASGSMQFVNGENIRYEFKTFKPITELNLKNVENYGILWYFYKNIFKREFIVNNNIKFPDLLRGQDPVFLCECLSRLDNFLEVPIIYYAYNTPNESKLNNSLKYHDYFLHFYEVFRLLMPQKRFAELITTYTEILTSMKNREVLVSSKIELLKLLTIMDNIYNLFIEFGEMNLITEVNLAFNEIMNKIKIENIEITVNETINWNDTYSESIIVIDNSQRPMISLIMYVYNNENNIAQCIESLLNQSYDDFELICIDDASTDNSYNILEKYANQDNRINIFSFTHKGKRCSIKRAIDRINGNYMAVINSKNIYDNNFVQEIYDYNQEGRNSKTTSTQKTPMNSENNAKINELEYLNQKYREYIQIKENHINMISDNRIHVTNEPTNFESNLNALNNQVFNQKKELDANEFLIKKFKHELKNKERELEYVKNSKGIFKNIISPLSYLYIIFKSKLGDIPINIKLYKCLKRTNYFDSGFYLRQYPETIETTCCKFFSPELHYVCFGFSENKKINNDSIAYNSKQGLYRKISKK